MVGILLPEKVGGGGYLWEVSPNERKNVAPYLAWGVLLLAVVIIPLLASRSYMPLLVADVLLVIVLLKT